MSDSTNEKSWPLLLAKYTQFAQAALSLPDAGEGGRWKRVTPQIITLHSVAMALEDLDSLPDADRPMALDRAEILCREAASAVHECWAGEPMPEGLTELISDARVAFEAAANAGVEWIVKSDRLELNHPGVLADRLVKSGFTGDLFLAGPGQPVFATSPAAFARAPGGAAPEDRHNSLISKFLGAGEGKVSAPERIGTPRQVYRQLDFAVGGLTLGGAGGGSGGPVKDLVVPMNEPAQPGQPILVLAIEAGEACAVPLAPPSRVRIESLPVEIMSQLEAKDPEPQNG